MELQQESSRPLPLYFSCLSLETAASGLADGAGKPLTRMFFNCGIQWYVFYYHCREKDLLVRSWITRRKGMAISNCLIPTQSLISAPLWPNEQNLLATLRVFTDLNGNNITHLAEARHGDESGQRGEGKFYPYILLTLLASSYRDLCKCGPSSHSYVPLVNMHKVQYKYFALGTH